jgi:O-methyltransferase involved in polyketide biosynthesis
VPLDFEHASLAEALSEAGFDPSAGAFFSWLGVTPYLTPAAVMSTLTYVAAVTTSGGGIVFDYALDPELLTHAQRAVFHAMAARVEAVGEPWRTTFEPRDLIGTLRSMGFPHVEDFGADALNARVPRAADGLRLGGLAHIMWAGGIAAGDATSMSIFSNRAERSREEAAAYTTAILGLPSATRRRTTS